MGLRGGSNCDLRASLSAAGNGNRGVFAEWLVLTLPVALAALLVASVAKAGVHASIVLEAQTGRVLESRHANELAYPASLAKLMTLYLVFQELDRGALKLHQKLRVSPHAAAQPPTKLWLRPGGSISVKSAILAITTRSANDAAVVLAEAVAGSESHFAHLMTRAGRRLGMIRTTFRNASGLPNPHQRTTARDMATLALAIIRKFPQYYHFFSVRSFVFKGKRIYGHDHLLGRYRGADGLKTGYTRASGYNLVTSCVRHGRRLVGVVMGGRSIATRDNLMIALLNRAYSRRDRRMLADRRISAKPHTVHVTDNDGKIERVSLETANSAPSRGWAVQIGHGFSSPSRVRHALASAIHTVPAILKHARALVIKLHGSHRRRYRARFSELSNHMARSVCLTLRRKKFTCTVMHIYSAETTLASGS